METSVNNKCKAFTSLEQSRKLAEILPIESADMKFPYFGNGQYGETARVGELIEFSGGKDIPCWSLAALLNILPVGTETHKQIYDSIECYYVEIYNNRKYFCTDRYVNLLDACVEMASYLHEQKLL